MIIRGAARLVQGLEKCDAFTDGAIASGLYLRVPYHFRSGRGVQERGKRFFFFFLWGGGGGPFLSFLYIYLLVFFFSFLSTV